MTQEVARVASYDAMLAVILDRLDGARVYVAHHHDAVYGWVVYNPGKHGVEYIYTKHLHRGKGVATSLIEHAIGDEQLRYDPSVIMTDRLRRYIARVYGA